MCDGKSPPKQSVSTKLHRYTGTGLAIRCSQIEYGKPVGAAAREQAVGLPSPKRPGRRLRFLVRRGAHIRRNRARSRRMEVMIKVLPVLLISTKRFNELSSLPPVFPIRCLKWNFGTRHTTCPMLAMLRRSAHGGSPDIWKMGRVSSLVCWCSRRSFVWSTS